MSFIRCQGRNCCCVFQVLNIAHDIGDRTLEARAYAGLGHAARSKGDHAQAKSFHEKQLDNALQTKDRVGYISSGTTLCQQLYS